VQVEGHVEPGWGAVADAFRRNFEHGDVGAAVGVYADGRPAVELYGGLADAEAGSPWHADTVVPVFSTTKGVTAICANLLIERGRLDPDAPVAAYWPKFAAAGKEGVLVRHALSHRAGLPAIEGDFTLEQALSWEPVVTQLARQAPRWPPGEGAPGYHMRSYGWIVGELVRRVTGQTIGSFFASEIAAPYSLDFWIGLPEELEPRVARLIPPAKSGDPELVALMDAFTAPGTMTGDTFNGPSGLFAYDEMWNTRALHACELPSSNGIGSASALARLYAATVGSVEGAPRLLAPPTVERARRQESDGPDRVLGLPMRYGLGFGIGPCLPPSCGPGAFGHSGAGGSLAFADVDAGIGFGYVMNTMNLGVGTDLRSEMLVRAVMASL